LTTKLKKKERSSGVLTLPHSIKIGSKDFSISYQEDLKTGGDYCLGLYKDSEREIFLVTYLKEDSWHELEVFLHEAAGHGLWSFFAMPEDEEAEEKFAEVISKGLTMILRDNPELVRAIYEIQRTK
jgi:hypothetical protein